MKDKTAKELLKKVKADYKEIASEFDQTRKFLWPEFKFFKKYIKSGEKILDIGCGNGRLSELFTNNKYIGLDNNTEFIKIAQKNYPSSKFVLGDLLYLPSGYQAGIIFSIAAFHHIPSIRLRKKSVQTLRNNLQENGILIITVWNLFQKRYIKYILNSLYKYITQFRKYDWNDTFIPWGKKEIKRYYHAFTPFELKSLFKSNGFEILEMFYTRKGKKVPFLISHNICLICRKK